MRVYKLTYKQKKRLASTLIDPDEFWCVEQTADNLKIMHKQTRKIADVRI